MPHSQVMDWTSLLSTRRFKLKNGYIEAARAIGGGDAASGLRSDFHIDHDRLVFSSAFRRLGRKTQVHPLAINDHTHNRLTHSVEVASVGRSLGNQVGAMLASAGRLPAAITPFDIGAVVQVACLAHDFGNPPFGHTGEDALRDWFRTPKHAHWLAPLSVQEQSDIRTYEGNAHGLRMVSSLELYVGEGGMRLTSAALGALVKYPWTSDIYPERGKFNVYRTELAYFEAIAEELGLIRRGDSEWVRHPLSYLMEAADDICYAILDLEDAVEIGILDVAEFEAALGELVEVEKTWPITDPRQRCSALRGSAVGKCVNEVAGRFMAFEPMLCRGEFPAKDLISVCSPAVRDTVQGAKALASHRIYRHRSKLVTEIAAYPCMATLLDKLVPPAFALTTGQPLSTREHLQLALMDRKIETGDSPYLAYMKILDFIGAMTDNTAATLAREVSGLGIH
ncbi:deoxyguanosinetriphosphate triphosphohydrolase [Craterilacuibacter sp.]|uniref:deoxyguanosinetriphosphate triphosphohydrolase n=1 Tax=Craterilacuibacter sp. TaxID=2870909 RepID=UPI003F39D755